MLITKASFLLKVSVSSFFFLSHISHCLPSICKRKLLLSFIAQCGVEPMELFPRARRQCSRSQAQHWEDTSGSLLASGSSREPGQEQPTVTQSGCWLPLNDNATVCLHWKLCVSHYRVKYQDDAEQMLTWSWVSVWERKSSLGFPDMHIARPAKYFQSFRAGCPTDISHTTFRNGNGSTDNMQSDASCTVLY